MKGGYHRWPSNEDADRHPYSDRCLDCRVPRFSDDPTTIARAEGACPGQPPPGRHRRGSGE